ncbi:GDSL-type esterase/lipase family protein [Kribbella sp. NPDC050124]|uniref:GDSL-type esterase/lipase family protein n=1 Tax=Kribbella sp. NPDC050124 TaxID=3364114 RepID=UPI0037A26F52
MPEWISTAITPELMRGTLELERTERGVLPRRLPGWARAQYDDPQLEMVESQPSGVRLVFQTRATAVELDTLPTKRSYTGAPATPDGVYGVLVDGELVEQATVPGGNVLIIDLTTGATETRPGAPGTVRVIGLSGDLKTVEIWLPHTETTELVALRTDAPIAPAPATERRTWLHHGSSISHGSNATSPTGTWVARAASLAGVELTNLGFGGSALLQPFVARTMRDTPADLISVKLGINVVNADVMRRRAFGPAVHGFLDTIRDGHPTTPLLVVSPIFCPMHEDTPGPTMWDLEALSRGELRFRATGDPADVPMGKLTLGVIREELTRIVAQRATDDPNLHYLDGRELYGEADNAELPLPDDLHPDGHTHHRMAERFAKLAFNQLRRSAGGSARTG